MQEARYHSCCTLRNLSDRELHAALLDLAEFGWTLLDTPEHAAQVTAAAAEASPGGIRVCQTPTGWTVEAHAKP